jgi:hypothetical protein
MLVRWLVFIHVLSAITFFLAHGASAAMVFKLRTETDFARIRAMLDLSISYVNVVIVSFFGMGITGLIMPFLIHIWDKGWIWLSIILILFVFFYMFWFDERSYKPLRKLVGLPYTSRRKGYPAEPPASPEEVAAHIKNINITSLVVIGYGIPVFVLWLMIFKPF